MAAPNVNGRLLLTGVHQKPPSSIATFRPERLVNHAEIVAMPLDGPGSIFRIFLLEPTHTFFEVQGSSYLLMIRYSAFQHKHRKTYLKNKKNHIQYISVSFTIDSQPLSTLNGP